MTRPEDRPVELVDAGEPSTKQRLWRSRSDRAIAGVCGGLGRYLGVDPTVVRILFVAAVILTGGAAVLVYLGGWLVIPETTAAEGPAVASRHGTAVVVGVALIAIGALMLLRAVIPWSVGWLFWPLVLVGVGVALLVSARR